MIQKSAQRPPWCLTSLAVKSKDGVFHRGKIDIIVQQWTIAPPTLSKNLQFSFEGCGEIDDKAEEREKAGHQVVIISASSFLGTIHDHRSFLSPISAREHQCPAFGGFSFPFSLLWISVNQNYFLQGQVPFCNNFPYIYMGKATTSWEFKIDPTLVNKLKL